MEVQGNRPELNNKKTAYGGAVFTEISAPKLELVQNVLPVPPYPPDTRAAGWHFQIDTTRVRQSDTWTLARPEIRPWLLMLWVVAWEQAPCGSLPADDALIAALLGIDAGMFAAHRNVLLRGWAKHADGRLYHGVVTEHVLAMCEARKKNRDKVAAWRNRLVTGNQPVSNPTGSGSGSGTGSGSGGGAGGTMPAPTAQAGPTRQAKKPQPKGTRLPADWMLPDEWKEWAVRCYHMEPQRAVRISLKFKDFWIAKPGADGCKLDWYATWRNWVRREMGDA